jgi:hypothetical protein
MTQTTADQLSTDQLEALLAQRKMQEAQERNKRRADYESLRETTVSGLIKEAKDLAHHLKDFKTFSFESMDALYELLKEYSNRHASDDAKGNFTIENATETQRICFAVQELGNFDERSKQAEKHIIDFVTRQFSNDANTQELIMKLLERTKGNLDIKLVQKLYSMEDKYDDASWKEGIRLLKESYQTHATKRYIRFYEKDENGEWQAISLSFSAV